jgi:hypothetical protein
MRINKEQPTLPWALSSVYHKCVVLKEVFLYGTNRFDEDTHMVNNDQSQLYLYKKEL